MMNKFERSRRQFLRTASFASMAGISASPFLIELSSIAAMAQSTGASDYKALVCLYMQGGNDGHGTVIATDTPSYDAFKTARQSAPGLVYPLSSLLPITPLTPQSQRTFALNPALTGVQNLFNAGRAAIVANVGTLVTTTTKDTINSVTLPDSLFSHFDQSAAWQAIASNGGSTETVGWGGRVADLIGSMNTTPTFTCISTAGIALFLSGEQTFQLNCTSAGPIPIYGLTQPLFGQPAGSVALNNILGLSTSETNLFAKEYGAVVNRSIAAQKQLQQYMLPAGTGGVPNPPQYLDPKSLLLTDNPLATSFQTVARIIGARAGLGVTRQVFFVELGGFDTHTNQAIQHAQLLTQLGAALEYFDGLMVTAGLGNNVTTFTISDFGRTLTSNSSGTDHGWGSHHFVVGGAVAGQNIYGQYPVVGVNQANDTGQGRLIPAIAVDQYAATLARWFGLTDAQVKDAFTNIGNNNFGSNPYLGFMGS